MRLAVVVVLGTMGLVGCEAPVREVRYEVSGDARFADFTISNESGNTEQGDYALPFTMKFNTEPGQHLYVSAQNPADGGVIECKIIVDDVVVARAVSAGPHKIANCSDRS